jgi:hypothetical protein
MSKFPGSPKLLRAGIVLLDADTSRILQVIVLQYNPETLTRTLTPKTTPSEAGDRLETMRLTGPAVETIKLDAEIDATDQLESPNENRDAAQFGIYPQLASLETIVYPTASQLQTNNSLAQAGTLEIVPVEAPLSVFVWSESLVVPVRLTEFSITEEAFDPALNPIRAKVSVGMRVLSVNDVPFNHRANSIFMAYMQQKQNLAGRNFGASLSALGISKLP